MNENLRAARAITESALVDLFEVLDTEGTPEDFLAAADSIVVNPSNQLALPVSLGIPDGLSVEGSRSVDIENAPRVHEYFGEMDRANASDARLWTYLSFVTFRSYMEERWPLLSDVDDSWKSRVRDRWLLHNGSITRGRLVRHGIARLWWVAHLTYDPDSSSNATADDAYAYTKEVFKSEDRINALFDREVGAIPTVMKAVLTHAAELGTAAKDKYIQSIMRYLRLVNGYRDIGVLDQSTINNLVAIAAERAKHSP